MTGHFDTPVLCPVKTRQKNDGTLTPTCIMSSQKVRRKNDGTFGRPCTVSPLPARPLPSEGGAVRALRVRAVR